MQTVRQTDIAPNFVVGALFLRPSGAHPTKQCIGWESAGNDGDRRWTRDLLIPSSSLDTSSSQQRGKGRVCSETNEDQEKKEGGGGGVRGRGRLKTTRSREIGLQSATDDGHLTSMLGKAFASDRFKFGDGNARLHFTICRIVRHGTNQSFSPGVDLSQLCR